MNRRKRLGVNIDHIATLRQARGTNYPDPVQAALVAQDAGADGLTLHLREDRRHIQDRDVYLIKDILQIPMNLEMAISDEMIAIAKKLKPEHCCLVPEKREELTTEGGLDVLTQEKKVRMASEELADAGIEVSLFIDPVKSQIEAARECGVPVIELHTGAYAEHSNEQHLTELSTAAAWADTIGLQVNAGHGLHYHNLHPVAAIEEIVEFNIGHSIIARAAFCGLHEAITEMKRLLHEN